MSTRLNDLIKARDAVTEVQAWLNNPTQTARYGGVCAAVNRLGYVATYDMASISVAAEAQYAMTECVGFVSARWRAIHGTLLAFPIPDPDGIKSSKYMYAMDRGYKWSDENAYGRSRLEFAKEVAAEMQKLIDHYSQQIKAMRAKERKRKENKNGEA